MVSSIKEARTIYEQRVGRRETLIEQKAQYEKDLKENKHKLDICIKARKIIQIVAKNTQQKIEFHISNLVTLALASVFPEPWEFSLRFEERRNGTEADKIFSKFGKEVDDILESGGGGVADVANLAFIPSLWSLNKTAPIFVQDEPDKFLHSSQYQIRTSYLLKMISERLKVQIIIVSDQPNIIAHADKVIRIGMKKGVSYVKGEEENG